MNPTKNLPERSFIETHKQNEVWDLANSVLYKLCEEHPEHNKPEKILAKTWLIGRSYAVALERRKIKDKLNNDDFYSKEVVPNFQNSELDKKLRTLKEKHKLLTVEALMDSLEIHKYLTALTCKFTEIEKRSFSSKYLHFHFPDLFFIYDSRAVAALGIFVKKIPKETSQFLTLADSKNVDKTYAEFACKCFYLLQEIEIQRGIKLTIRELDTLFLKLANEKLKARK